MATNPAVYQSVVTTYLHVLHDYSAGTADGTEEKSKAETKITSGLKMIHVELQLVSSKRK